MARVKDETEKTLRYTETQFVTLVMESVSSKRKRIKKNSFYDID